MKIGTHEVTLKPIRIKPVEFDKKGRAEVYVNLKGEPLKKIQLQKSEFKWVNEKTGTEHDAKVEVPSKAFKGQPVGTQEKTKVVESYEQCEKEEILNYAVNSKTYLVVSETLKAELKQDGKAVTFQYNSGRNYLPEKAIVYYDDNKGVVLMKCLSGNMSDYVFDEKDEKPEVEIKQKAKPLTIQI